MIQNTMFAADNKTGSNCSKELTEWNAVNFQMGGVTLAGQLDVSAATAAELRQLQDSGIDVSGLQKAPCSLQVALLPFGDKDQPLLFTGGPHHHVINLSMNWRHMGFCQASLQKHRNRNGLLQVLASLISWQYWHVSLSMSPAV